MAVIGKNIAITMVPTIKARKTISKGSMMEDKLSTAESTSSS